MKKTSENELTSEEINVLLEVLIKWVEHDKEVVLLAYNKLKRRNFFVPGHNTILTEILIGKSVSNFCYANSISNIDHPTSPSSSNL